MKTCRKCGALYESYRCLQCSRERDRKRYAANPKRSAAAVRAWQAKNPKKMSAAVAKWQSENPEKRKAANDQWRANHPGCKRIWDGNRRARKINNGGKLSSGLAEKLFKLQRGKCACCGKPLGDDYHLDHRAPLALGGANEDRNMQLLRPLCNATKGAKDPIEFMRQRGFLL